MTGATLSPRAGGGRQALTPSRSVEGREDGPRRFEVMHDDCRRRVEGLVRRFIPGAELAEDIVQEAFLRAYIAGLHLEEGGADPWPWLAAVARNLSLDALRRQRRFVEMPVGDQPDEPCSAIDPEGRAMRQADLEGIQEALDAIAPRHRAVLVLRHLRGWCYSDIAEMEGLTPEAVKSLLARARRNFRRQYLADSRRNGWTNDVT